MHFIALLLAFYSVFCAEDKNFQSILEIDSFQSSEPPQPITEVKQLANYNSDLRPSRPRFVKRTTDIKRKEKKRSGSFSRVNSLKYVVKKRLISVELSHNKMSLSELLSQKIFESAVRTYQEECLTRDIAAIHDLFPQETEIQEQIAYLIKRNGEKNLMLFSEDENAMSSPKPESVQKFEVQFELNDIENFKALERILFHGIRSEDEEKTTNSIKDILDEIKGVKLLEALCRAFKIAHLRFTNIVAYIYDEEAKIEKSLCSKEIKNFLKGGVELTKYLWSYAEYIKFVSNFSEINDYRDLPAEIFNLELLEYLDYFHKEYQINNASLIKQKIEPPTPKEEYEITCFLFVKSLVAFKDILSEGAAAPSVEKYVEFLVMFVVHEYKHAVKLYQFYPIQEKGIPITEQQGSAFFSRRFSPEKVPVQKPSFKQLMRKNNSYRKSKLLKESQNKSKLGKEPDCTEKSQVKKRSKKKSPHNSQILKPLNSKKSSKEGITETPKTIKSTIHRTSGEKVAATLTINTIPPENNLLEEPIIVRDSTLKRLKTPPNAQNKIRSSKILAVNSKETLPLDTSAVVSTNGSTLARTALSIEIEKCESDIFKFVMLSTFLNTYFPKLAQQTTNDFK
jgi:hypothetical protein